MQRFRKHINPASILAFVALVFAATGGAYAAGGGGGGNVGGSSSASHVTAQVAKSKSKKKTTSSGKPGPRGPAGPAGPAGAAGAKGETGPAGAAGATGGVGKEGKEGKQGEPGKNGTNGTDGTDGESVTATEFTGAQGSCTSGGSEFAVGGTTTYACNGGSGMKSGESEIGSWSVAITQSPALLETGYYEGVATITFPRPLTPTQLSALSVYVLKGSSTECPRGGEEPEAAENSLCIYITNTNPLTGAYPEEKSLLNVTRSDGGVVVRFRDSKPEGILTGSWALKVG